MRIEIMGKFYDHHSLSIVNRNLAIGLSEKDIEVCITPFDNYDSSHKLEKEVLSKLEKLKNKATEIPDIQIRHTYPPMWRWPANKETKVVYIQPWEFSRIPSEWQYKFDTFADGVITPSSWTTDKYLDAGLAPDKVFTIPNGYNEKVFKQEKVPCDLIPNSNKFTFTFVGCSQFRKGVDILLNAWSKSFVKADNVQLFLKDNPQIYGQNNLLSETVKMQYLTGCGKIIYNSDILSEEEMASVYKNTDVLVHPYRGEGFGMHIQEAMACGATPIVTSGGAADDFVNQDNSIMLTTAQQFIDLSDPKLMAMKPGDSLSGMGGHSWVLEPDQEDLINKMKLVYFHHERDQILSRVDKAKLTTWKDAINLYVEVLENIYKRDNIRRIA